MSREEALRALQPLEPGRAAASELHRRMVFAVGPEREATAEALSRLPSIATRRPGPDIVARGGLQLVGNFLAGTEGGVASLAGFQDFLTAVRELLDAPFVHLLAETGREFALDLSPADAQTESLSGAVWPDAWWVEAVEQFAQREAASPVEPATPVQRFDGRLVLVLGAPRSGTTWLTQLLLAHPETCGAGEAETWLFRGLGGFWSNDDLAGWLPPDAVVAALRRFCDRLFGVARAAAANPVATHFVEKTPAHVWHVEQITTLYPDVKIVHILRDGRDVARSLGELSFGTETVTEGARGWREYVETARERLGTLDHFEVRYEELAADPVGQTGRILEWIGLDVGDAQRAAIGARAGTRVSQYGTTGPVGPGKWRQLDDHALDAVWREAGGLLRSLGYGTPPKRRWLRRRRRES
jgi:hypothetical protein